MTCLDRRVTGSNGGLVGRDGGRHAVLAANRAAVGRGFPRHDQRDICAAIIANTVCVGILVIAILRRAIAANGAGFAALVLNIICLRP